MDSARRACRDHSSLYPVPRRPGPLVDPASARIWDQMGRDSWSILCQIGTGTESARIAGRARVSSNPGRVGRDSWSTPQRLGPGSELAGPADRNRVSSDLGPNGSGLQADPVSTRTRDRVGRDKLVDPRAFGPWSESAGTAGRPRGTWDPEAIGPVELVSPCFRSDPGPSLPG